MSKSKMNSADNFSHLTWKEESRKKLFSTHVFDVYAATRIINDVKAEFTVLESRDWVNVIPVLKEGDEEFFLMVHQFRHGSGEITTEFPAGVIDPGEGPEKAARRELLEETGFEAESIIPIGKINPNPAFMNNICHTYLARGLKEKSGQNLDEHEFLEVEKLSVKYVRENMGKGVFTNGIMVIALYWYDMYLKKHGVQL